MTNEDYLKQVKILLDKENVKPHLKVQILETVIELLEHYSVTLFESCYLLYLENKNLGPYQTKMFLGGQEWYAVE